MSFINLHFPSCLGHRDTLNASIESWGCGGALLLPDLHHHYPQAFKLVIELDQWLPLPIRSAAPTNTCMRVLHARTIEMAGQM